MAKKSRRVRKQGRPARLSPAQMALPEVRKAADASMAAVPVQPVPGESDLREEYRYVIADLKRIGIIAAAMLVVLIALALLLT